MERGQLPNRICSSRKRTKQAISSTSSMGSKNQEHEIRAHRNRMRVDNILNSQDSRSSGRKKKRFRPHGIPPAVTGDSPPDMDRGKRRMDIGFLLNEEDREISRDGRGDRASSRSSRSDRGVRDLGSDRKKSKSVEDSSGSRSSRREKMGHFRCPCSAMFSSPDQLILHRKERHNNKSMFCPYCPSVYSRYDSVRNHVEEKHTIPGEKWCHKCYFVTTNPQNYDRHMAVQHHVCNKCGKVYTRHLREHTQGCQPSGREG